MRSRTVHTEKPRRKAIFCAGAGSTTPALTLPQVRYGLSVLLEVFCSPGIDFICRQVYRQLMRNELARFYHHRARKCIPPRKLRREIP